MEFSLSRERETLIFSILLIFVSALDKGLSLKVLAINVSKFLQASLRNRRHVAVQNGLTVLTATTIPTGLTRALEWLGSTHKWTDWTTRVQRLS